MKRLLFLVLVLSSCAKQDKFHKAIQGDWEIRTINTYWGTTQNIPSNSGNDFTITESTLNGWHFTNEPYEVLSNGIIGVSNDAGDYGELPVSVGDNLVLKDVYGNELIMELK